MITVEAGAPLARAAGDFRELNTTRGYYSGKPDYRTDTYRDLYNNEVGYEIGRYARDNDLTSEQVQSLVVEAMEHGDLIESIHRENPDPRLPSNISDNPGQNGFIIPEGPYNGYPSTFHANTSAPFWGGPNREFNSRNPDYDDDVTSTSTGSANNGTSDHQPDPIIISGGGTGADERIVTTSDKSHIGFGDNAPPYYDYDHTNGTVQPIILDLDGDGVEVGFGNPVYFDIDGDGFKEQTSWVASDDGFLVIDLNADGSRGIGDGRIDQARELAFALWGDATDTDLLGFRRAFDLNGDGILNQADAVWTELRVWRDLNQNGESDAGELLGLDGLGISSINLSYDGGAGYDDATDDITVFGNTLKGLASMTRNGQVVGGSVGDVELRYNKYGRYYNPETHLFQFESASNGDSNWVHSALTRTGFRELNERPQNLETSLEYTASYSDLIIAFGADEAAAESHFRNLGLDEGRKVSFNALDYIASYSDVMTHAGTDELAGARHFIQYGYNRSVTFNGLAYLAANSDLSGFGVDGDLGARHFIEIGWQEGRQTTFDALGYLASNPGLISSFGTDLVSATEHYILHGRAAGLRTDTFDALQYLSNYADIRAGLGNNVDAAKAHFVQVGYAQGRHDNVPVTGYYWDTLVSEAGGAISEELFQTISLNDIDYHLFGYDRWGTSTDLFYGAVYFGTLEFGSSDGWGTPGYLRALSDVNGDGRADIVAFGQGGAVVALGQSNGTFAAAQYGTNEFGSDQGWGFDIYQRSLADVNGDGRADIVAFGHNHTVVAFGQSNGTFQQAHVATSQFSASEGWGASSFERVVADVNGDGRADIVAFGSLGTLVALGQSAGTFESAIWASSEFGNDNGWGLASFDRRVADVNGDGMADVIGFGQGGVMVALGTGNGTFTTATLATEQFSLDSGWNAEQHLRLVQDIDSDGRADIIGFGEAATYVALGQADGTFATAYVATGRFTTNGGWANDTFERQIADVNGDGLADIVGFGENGTEVSLGDNRHNSQVVDDNIRGTSLTDWIDGDVGSDELHGLEGDDFIFGKHGNDALFGGAGNDFIAGGAHNDTLISGAGNDILIGGSDSDVFHFTAETGHNSILDFQNSVDSLEFGLGFHFDHLQIQSHVNSVILSFSNIEGFSIAFQDISSVYIDANNFM